MAEELVILELAGRIRAGIARGQADAIEGVQIVGPVGTDDRHGGLAVRARCCHGSWRRGISVHDSGARGSRRWQPLIDIDMALAGALRQGLSDYSVCMPVLDASSNQSWRRNLSSSGRAPFNGIVSVKCRPRAGNFDQATVAR